MRERLRKAHDAAKKVTPLARWAGEGVVKTTVVAAGKIKERQEEQRLEQKGRLDTRYAAALVALGGYSNDRLHITDEGIRKQHELNKRYRGLTSAYYLALQATGVSEGELETGEDLDAESESVMVEKRNGLLKIQLKDQTDYSIVRFRHDPEIKVGTEAVIDKNTGNNIKPYYAQYGTAYNERNSDDQLIGAGGTSYRYPGNPSDSVRGFDRAFEYIGRAAREIGQAAFGDLVAQGAVTDEIESAHRIATGQQT